MKNAPSVKLFLNRKIPEHPGTYHRLLCMTGQNKGHSYILSGDRIVMGRSDAVDISILDPKASREHIEIVRVGSDYILTDMHSQNGTIVNDLKVTQHKMSDGDNVIVGKTVYKYTLLQVEEPLPEIEEDSEIADSESSEKNKKKAKGEEGEKRKKIVIFSVVIIAALALFLPTEKEQKSKESGREIGLVDSSDTLSREVERRTKEENKELDEKIAVLIHNGLRELREKNYYRAIYNFELALIMDPNHYRAKYYKDKTTEELDREIEQHFDKAKKDLGALKKLEAASEYCAVTRLIHRNTADERYKAAMDNLRVIERELGLEQDEIRCN